MKGLPAFAEGGSEENPFMNLEEDEKELEENETICMTVKSFSLLLPKVFAATCMHITSVFAHV